MVVVTGRLRFVAVVAVAVVTVLGTSAVAAPNFARGIATTITGAESGGEPLPVTTSLERTGVPVPSASISGPAATSDSASSPASANSTASAPTGTEAAAEAPVGQVGFRRLCPPPTQPGQMACLGLEREQQPAGSADAAGRAGAPAGYGPADLQSAYRLPSEEGDGHTVAIVDAYDNPVAEADLAVYRAHFGLPPCTTENGCFRKVNQEGEVGPLPAAANAGWGSEISLDVQMVSAACPKCRILLVEANSENIVDLVAGVKSAIRLGARIVSNSYGAPEYPQQSIQSEQLDQPGVAITAASGDGGYGVSFPASSRYVTAVGGTTLKRANNARGWTETAWINAGSGCSAYEPKPAHQVDADCPRRSVADVSVIADPKTGVAVYDTFQAAGEPAKEPNASNEGWDGWQVYGGTSAAAPIVAAAYALAGGPPAGSRPNEYPYQSPFALFDVTAGSNGTCGGYLCTGGHGYDGPTGLGSLNGLAALRAPTGPFGRVEGLVTNAENGQPVDGARVGVGGASMVTGADGRYALRLPAGDHEVSITARGYREKSADVKVPADATAVADFGLTDMPTVQVSGTVWDGSGHGWPLYAGITVDGVPGAVTFTDPVTGRYELQLKGGAAYKVRVTPGYPGYQTLETTVSLDERDRSVDFAALVDEQACTAPGYLPRAAASTDPSVGTSATFDAVSPCLAVDGGLVVGNVYDSNTLAAVNGVTVQGNGDHPTSTGRSVSTPDDPGLGDGFYWLFLPLPMTHSMVPVIARGQGYGESTETVMVQPESTVRTDFAIEAGLVAVSPVVQAKRIRRGSTTTVTFRVTNTGTRPANVRVATWGRSIPWLSARPGRFTLQPGASITVRATLSARHKTVGQRGVYPAWLVLMTDTPYWTAPAGVIMKVTL